MPYRQPVGLQVEESLKVEAGESLVLSWLRHVVGCQIVQLNWKPSVDRWKLHGEEELEAFVVEMETHFSERRNRDIFNQGEPDQLIRQGEIDVLGLRRDENGLRLYAVDVANHFAGLNHGSRDETIARVLKKLVRSAASTQGYFPGIPTEVLFASPKVPLPTRELLTECIGDINESLRERALPVEVRLVCNEEFASEIVRKVVDCADSVADTSELFLRTVQLCHIAGISPMDRRRSRSSSQRTEVGTDEAGGEPQGAIAAHVRQQLKRLIDRGLIPLDEIGRLQDLGYSRRTFGMSSYPILRWHDQSLPRSTRQYQDAKGRNRYYASTITIGDERYYLCSQWVDGHRPDFDRWVARMEAGAAAASSAA